MATTIYKCGEFFEVYTTRLPNQKKKPVVNGLNLISSVSPNGSIPSDILINQSYHRAKEQVKRLLLTNLSGKPKTDIFFTLTYKDNMQNYRQSQKDFRRFRDRARKHGYDFPYLVISENQKRGAIHHHGVFFGTGKIDIEKLTKIWQHGFIFLEYIKYDKPPTALAFYMTKYLTKQKENEKHTKHYRTSYNLKKPLKFKSDDLYIDDINNPFKILYKSEYTPWYSEPTKYRLCHSFGGKMPPKLRSYMTLTK